MTFAIIVQQRGEPRLFALLVDPLLSGHGAAVRLLDRRCDFVLCRHFPFFFFSFSFSQIHDYCRVIVVDTVCGEITSHTPSV